MTTTEKVMQSQWNPEKKLITTTISGHVNAEDIEAWENSLQSALAQVPPHSDFKIFVNLFGFQATDFPAHKQFRTIIPLTLARFGWKVGYVALFDEANSFEVSTDNDVRCVAAVHVHQDATKIERYQSLFGSEKEAFFTDPEIAESWIEKIPV